MPQPGSRTPHEPRFRENAIDAAEALLAFAEARFRENGLPDDLLVAAEACRLRALDSGLDRAFAAKALLSENQVQLGAVSRPIPATLLTRLLRGMNRCQRLAGTRRGRSEEDIADFADAYHKALALTYQPENAVAAIAFSGLAERSASNSKVPVSFPPTSGSAGQPASTAAMGALYSARPSAAADMLGGLRGDASSRPSETSLSYSRRSRLDSRSLWLCVP